MLVNRSVPGPTIVPILVYADVDAAISWLCEVFGFKERLRVTGPDGQSIHAQLAIADGAVMLGRQGGQFQAPIPGVVSQFVHVRVPDVNRHHDQARQRGARIISSPTSKPFGERQYTAADLGGHWWVFSESIADVSPASWGATAAGQ